MIHCEYKNDVYGVSFVGSRLERPSPQSVDHDLAVRVLRTAKNLHISDVTGLINNRFQYEHS